MDRQVKRLRAMCAAVCIGIGLVPWPAAAQAFPDKNVPVKIVVPFGAGSAVDAVGRALAKAMSDTAGLNAIVDNKPGGETVIGVQAVRQAPADGYTILLVSSSTPVLNPLMMPNPQIDIGRDFVPLTTVAKNYPAFINLGASTNFKSIHEFIAAAKANPGKYTFASATSTSQLAGQMLQSVAGIQLVNVPYKTISAAVVALAAGEVDMLITDAGSVRAQWDSGRVRPVAIGAPARNETFSQVPTMAESGFASYQFPAWFATYVDVRTPPERVKALRTVLQAATRSAPFVDALAKFYIEPFHLSGDEVTALTKRDIETWSKVIKDAKTPRSQPAARP
jgi:tripartite-type tricarboxylate transporter receptor subunit TctC